ncbi:MAG: Na/Pi cotransporter family protein, partial [Phycisphaerae bacterium]|nr:Na/Pi cotransporter family protein [Phycisphaerae bacterium]
MEAILNVLGGLGFFMYGMHLMSGALRKVASHQLRRILGALTKTRVKGLLMGALVTAVVQSSSFTTVMTVGLVNAALLTLKQGICVILGANIGTTVTAWIVGAVGAAEHFKITNYALPAVAIGFFLACVVKRQNIKNWGSVLLGFGMLFVGIWFMKEAFAVSGGDTSSWAHEFFENFSRQPLLGILAGAVLTMLLQSSSVTIMIVQVLALNNLISFEAALTIVLGDNIGTTITAQIAALQSTTAGKRVAWAHTLFNVTGTLLLLPFLYIGRPDCLWGQLVSAVSPSQSVGVKIAMAHFLFNTINAVVIFLPAVSLLERASIFLVRGREGELELGAASLERHLLATPVVALDQVRREIVRMLAIARSALADAAAGFFESKELRRLADAQAKEDVVDNLQAEITQYLIELSEQGLSPEEAEQLPVFMHTVNDV